MKKKKQTLDSASLDALREYISLLRKEGKNSEDRLVAIARYCYYTLAQKNDLCTYFPSILEATNVLPNMCERLATIAGKGTRRKVHQEIEFPSLGAPQDDYPKLTKTILERMEAELSPAKCREAMTWNYHKVPAATFKEAKKRFEKSTSIEEYLKGEHGRLC